MAVAKSFQEMEIVGEPFTLDKGRQYVNVRNPKTGKLRQVRWYTDAEYRKLYPAAGGATDEVLKKDDPFYKPQKEVLGFTKGYITIFKGDTYAELDWFRASIARYARWWGWYIISTEEVPEDLPAGIEPVRLMWESVGNEDGKLKIESEVKKAVEALMFDPGTSEFVGGIGERLDLALTVKKVVQLEGAYPSNMHIMEDDDGNVFVWTTSSKRLTEELVYTMRGTVKDHRVYRNVNQTILTRCMNIQEA